MHHNRGLYQQSSIKARNISYCKHQGLTIGVKYEFNTFIEREREPNLSAASWPLNRTSLIGNLIH